MAYVPMNRARALIICTRPQDYLPGRLREAARYLLNRRDVTEEEKSARAGVNAQDPPQLAPVCQIISNLLAAQPVALRFVATHHCGDSWELFKLPSSRGRHLLQIS